MDSQFLLPFILRLYFLSTSLAVLTVHFLPPLHKAFIPYGKTRHHTTSPQSMLDRISGLTVPKAWFWHYYFLSVLLSIFWGLISVHGLNGWTWLRIDSARECLVWGMLLVQGVRRLYESLFILRASKARMWIGHYLVGCAFYTAMNLAVIADPPRSTPTNRAVVNIRFLLEDGQTYSRRNSAFRDCINLAIPMPLPPRFPPSSNHRNRSLRTPSHLEFILPIIPDAALYR
jgi:3-oxo-5-alpha-steroid 4-dehydrogenase 3